MNCKYLTTSILVFGVAVYLLMVSGCKSGGLLFTDNPPISTSIQDAVTDVPFLDGYNPEYFRPMALLPRDSNSNNFLIKRPGDYELLSQSYCLQAGSYGPTTGDGYIYAPLKGPFADIVRNILQRSVVYPEIPQHDIQRLIWAIISRSKLTNMSPQVKIAMARLLTPEEILKVNGGALGLLPDKLKTAAFNRLPAEVQSVLKAEAELRNLFQNANATYEELEALAVRIGEAPWGKDSRAVPKGRWSYHPDGFFVRYFPKAYYTVQVHLSYPEQVMTELDSMQRITLIQDTEGNQIRIKYNDTLACLKVNGNRLIGYAFQSIQFFKAVPVPPEVVLFLDATWDNKGWSFQGSPVDAGNIEVTDTLFGDANERLDIAGKQLLQLQALGHTLNTAKYPAIMVDLAHLEIALKKLLAEQPQANAQWANDHLNLLYRAWQTAFVEWVRTGDGRAAIQYPPSGNTATPGNTSKQRLEMSGREQQHGDDEHARNVCDALQSELDWMKAMKAALGNSDLAERFKESTFDDYYKGVRKLAKIIKDKGGVENFSQEEMDQSIDEATKSFGGEGEGTPAMETQNNNPLIDIGGYVYDKLILICEYKWADGVWIKYCIQDNLQSLIDQQAWRRFQGDEGAATEQVKSWLDHESFHAEQYKEMIEKNSDSDPNNDIDMSNTITNLPNIECPAYEASIKSLTESLKKLGCGN